MKKMVQKDNKYNQFKAYKYYKTVSLPDLSWAIYHTNKNIIGKLLFEKCNYPVIDHSKTYDFKKGHTANEFDILFDVYELTKIEAFLQML